MITTGTLYLVPSTLGECSLESVIPAGVQSIAKSLRYFIVENAKSARAELKRIGVESPIQEIDIRVLPRTPKQSDLDDLLAPLASGKPAGLMSEAGVPAVADPGAMLVRAAHFKCIQVMPLVGPSSILLALMASGLNGQRFAFHGYLPVREPERSIRIAELERESKKRDQTQVFIETPYRNAALFDALLQTCHSDSLLCLASDLTMPTQVIGTKTIEAWRYCVRPAIGKRPTVFLLLSV